LDFSLRAARLHTMSLQQPEGRPRSQGIDTLHSWPAQAHQPLA
jgi:hypothetical protein